VFIFWNSAQRFDHRLTTFAVGINYHCMVNHVCQYFHSSRDLQYSIRGTCYEFLRELVITFVVPDEREKHSEILSFEGGECVIASWDIAPCSLMRVDLRFSGAYCLHYEDD
jgi:hypothetical protein